MSKIHLFSIANLISDDDDSHDYKIDFWQKFSLCLYDFATVHLSTGLSFILWVISDFQVEQNFSEIGRKIHKNIVLSIAANIQNYSRTTRKILVCFYGLQILMMLQQYLPQFVCLSGFLGLLCNCSVFRVHGHKASNV